MFAIFISFGIILYITSQEFRHTRLHSFCGGFFSPLSLNKGLRFKFVLGKTLFQTPSRVKFYHGAG